MAYASGLPKNNELLCLMIELPLPLKGKSLLQLYGDLKKEAQLQYQRKFVQKLLNSPDL